MRRETRSSDRIATEMWSVVTDVRPAICAMLPWSINRDLMPAVFENKHAAREDAQTKMATDWSNSNDHGDPRDSDNNEDENKSVDDHQEQHNSGNDTATQRRQRPPRPEQQRRQPLSTTPQAPALASEASEAADGQEDMYTGSTFVKKCPIPRNSNVCGQLLEFPRASNLKTVPRTCAD